jgi:hypothetical protein
MSMVAAVVPPLAVRGALLRMGCSGEKKNEESTKRDHAQH